jgi:2-methylcitrate dehydratase PrpD
MGQVIEKLAQFLAQTQWDDIPAPVQQHAKLVLLDTIGVILAGSVRPEVAALRQRMSSTAGPGATVYAPGAPTHDPRTAALLNGIAGRAIELCEGLRLASGQPAMQILPGILAVGEHACASGKNLLTALVLGYEAGARFGMAFTPRPLAHQNGQAMLLAAAAAGARMRGLDAAGVSLAMRVSAVMMMTPSYTNTGAGATALNVAGGMAGFAGAFAPDLALAGFEAQPDAIEEHRTSARRTGHALGDHAQLFSAACVLQSDPPGAGCAARRARRAKAARRGDRAHRVRHLSLRLGDVQSGAAELFRV